MGELEDEVRSRIKELYGSIPKMAEASGMAQNTVYHALDRGLDNTTTRTRKMIFDALMRDAFEDAAAPVEDDDIVLDADEREIVDLYRAMDDGNRRLLLDTARAFAVVSARGR